MSYIIKNIIDEIAKYVIHRKPNDYKDGFEFEHKKKSQCYVDSENISIYVQNAWCLPIVSPDLKERFEKVKEIIREEKYDVIVLLEMWISNYREELIKECEKNDYVHYSYGSGIGMPICADVNGSGMMIFSKLNMIEAKHHRYSVNGIPHMIQHSDYYGGKGVGLCRLLSSDDKSIDLYVTHLHSTYESDHKDYMSVRSVQMYELCEFIKDTHNPNSLFLLLGDLNTSEGQLPFEILKSSFYGLKDCWLEYIGDKSGDVADISSCTFDCPDNTYRDVKESPQRLDYVFYISDKNDNWLLKECKIEKKYCKSGKSLSDHYGLSVVFSYDKIGETENNRIKSIDNISVISENEDDNNDRRIVLENMKEVIQNDIKSQSKKRKYNVRNGISIYVISLLLIVIFGNNVNRWLLLILNLSLFFSIYIIVYSILILDNDIGQYREVINQLNLRLSK